MSELDADKFEILAPDLMNLGLSADLGKSNFKLENHVAYLSEFFKAKARPGAILAVQDWGGPIGLLAAKRNFHLFDGFVILNTGLAAPQFPLRLSWFHKLSNTPVVAELVFGCLGFPMYTLHKVQHDPASIQGSVARAYRFPIGFGRRLSALRYARMVPSSETHPSLPYFRELEEFCRMLRNVEVVWGTKDPILGKQIHKVRSILPQAKIHEVEAGHFLQEEAYREIATAISNAAARLD